MDEAGEGNQIHPQLMLHWKDSPDGNWYVQYGCIIYQSSISFIEGLYGWPYTEVAKIVTTHSHAYDQRNKSNFKKYGHTNILSAELGTS